MECVHSMTNIIECVYSMAQGMECVKNETLKADTDYKDLVYNLYWIFSIMIVVIIN